MEVCVEWEEQAPVTRASSIGGQPYFLDYHSGRIVASRSPPGEVGDSAARLVECQTLAGWLDLHQSRATWRVMTVAASLRLNWRSTLPSTKATLFMP